MTEPGTREIKTFAPGERVAVLPPMPFDDAFDYRVPEGMAVAEGAVVRVPFGGRAVVGVVWGAGGDGNVPDAKIKEIEAVMEARPLGAPLRKLIDWVAAYTVSARGSVLRMALSVPEALTPLKPRVGYLAGDAPPARMTEARSRVLAVAKEQGPLSASDLARAADVSSGVVRGLADQGALRAVPLPGEEPLAAPDAARPGPVLSDDQQAAADALCARVHEGFGVDLIDGVTGSGKTEVYFEAVAAALRAGRQVLVLVPEIALTSQWLERFQARFGAPPVEWHSELGSARRRRVWRAVADGRARVVVGARSALFLPYRDLGLIVIDEEHDHAFKQEDGVTYHARDMGVVRGRMEDCPVVLVSATPSLETMINVERGRYRRHVLAARHGGATLPEIDLIDMRRENLPAGTWLSKKLAGALQQTVGRGEQAMLFLNRRGYAPLTLCRGCGHRLECPNCSAWLVEHRYRLGGARLQCHHCGYSAPMPEECPECGVEDRFAACGPGVERLAEEVAATVPGCRYAVMTSDTVTGPKAAADLVGRMARGELDLLIGTQMMAKGYHFPKLTLVGVVDADLGLAGGDLRAAERTYQLLAQVAGRAGRAEHPGRVVLQSYMPEHPVMRALIKGDRDAFFDREAEERRMVGAPPFGRLAAVILSSPDEREAAGFAREVAGRIASAIAKGARGDADLLGPAPAPLALLRGRYRQRLLVKSSRSVNLSGLIRAALGGLKTPARVRVQVDIDPYSFL